MNGTETKTYVEFWYRGVFVDEPSIRETASRDTARITVPEGVYAFSFFDIMSSEVNGELLESGRLNESPRYFYGGRIMTLAEVKMEIPDSRILQDNMTINRWSRVIRCRTGNFQPFTDSDAYVPERNS